MEQVDRSASSLSSDGVHRNPIAAWWLCPWAWIDGVRSADCQVLAIRARGIIRKANASLTSCWMPGIADGVAMWTASG